MDIYKVILPIELYDEYSGAAAASPAGAELGRGGDTVGYPHGAPCGGSMRVPVDLGSPNPQIPESALSP